MISMVQDSFQVKDFAPGVNLKEENTRYVTYAYRVDKQHDLILKKAIETLLDWFQPKCSNCEHCTEQIDCMMCDVHGLINYYQFFNPDQDGTLCDDYKRKKMQ